MRTRHQYSMLIYHTTLGAVGNSTIKTKSRLFRTLVAEPRLTARTRDCVNHYLRAYPLLLRLMVDRQNPRDLLANDPDLRKLRSSTPSHLSNSQLSHESPESRNHTTASVVRTCLNYFLNLSAKPNKSAIVGTQDARHFA